MSLYDVALSSRIRGMASKSFVGLTVVLFNASYTYRPLQYEVTSSPDPTLANSAIYFINE